MNQKKLFIGVAAMVFSIGLPPCGSAKETEINPDIQYLDEVVVTATRTENKVMETPSNIGVIKAEDLEKMDAKTVAEAIKKLPGVYYTNASGLQPKLSLRGTHIGMSGGALVLLNGIPVNMGKFGYTDFESLPVKNIERVEVVKGPMSALYGGDSARGVINIITKQGNNPFEGSIDIIGGTDNDQRYSTLVYGTNNSFDYNLNVKKRIQDGFRDDTSIDNTYLNGEIGYFLSDTTRLSFALNLTDSERDLAKKLTEKQRKENRRQAPDYSTTETTDIISGLTLVTTEDNYDLHSTVYYKNRDKVYENYKRATRIPYQETLDEDILGTRFLFSLKQPVAGRKNTFSTGFDYDYDTNDLQTIKGAARKPSTPYTRPDPKKSGDFTRQEFGLFIQDEFKIVENLVLTAGLRWDYFSFENNADYDFSRGGKKTYDKNPDFDEWNPRFSIIYLPLKNLSIYTGYSRAYRAPNIYDYYASGTPSATYAYTLKPETFTQYELGSRFGYSLGFNLDATLFHITIDDMLDTAYADDGTYMGKQNISEATLKGLELSLSGSPLDWFVYSIAYTYTDARYSDTLLYKISPGKTVNVDGNRLTKVPYHKLNIDLDFRLFHEKKYTLLWHVNLLAQDEYEMDKANSEQYDGFALVNTKLRLVHDRFEIFFSVDNVFDKDYDGYAYRSGGKNYYFPAAGTTMAAGFTYKF